MPGSEEIGGRSASGAYGADSLTCGEKVRDKGIGDTPGTQNSPADGFVHTERVVLDNFLPYSNREAADQHE